MRNLKTLILSKSRRAKKRTYGMIPFVESSRMYNQSMELRKGFVTV
jgi:hypothetical protein